MMAGLQRSSPIIATIVFVFLLLPPVKRALEASMLAQMLVQVPLLITVGWLACDGLPRPLTAATEAWNYSGITGLVLATLTAAFWMLPRSLDAAVTDPVTSVAKFVSVPLLIGLPLALSWPRMGFVMRGLVISELVAMFFRLGWLYLISPARLCNNYLLDDQQRAGKYMLLVGFGIVLWVVGKLLWGRFDIAQRET